MTESQPAAAPIGVSVFLIVIATSALSLRFVSRKLSDAGFWWDDWLALAAWPFSVTISATFFAAAWHGFGRHGGNPTFFLHVLYFDEVLYNTGIALTKLSVLAFYRRIFSITRPLKTAISIAAVLVIAWWISFTMASILQCVPVQGYWHPKVRARCVYKYGFFLGQAIPNIVLDFVILLLPLHPLWKLNMKLSQRIALVAVFVLAYLNPVVSILRIVSFIQLGNKTGEDINYNFISPALWSATEVSIAIFSCSIPSLTYLFRRVINRTTSDSARQPKDQPSSYLKICAKTNQKSNDKQQNKSFQRLRDEYNLVENIGLDRKDVDTQITTRSNAEGTLGSHGPNDILVTRDINVGDPSALA